MNTNIRHICNFKKFYMQCTYTKVYKISSYTNIYTNTYSLRPKESVFPLCFNRTCASAFVKSLELCPLIDEIRSPSRMPLSAALLPGLTCNTWNTTMYCGLSATKINNKLSTSVTLKVCQFNASETHIFNYVVFLNLRRYFAENEVQQVFMKFTT